VPCDPGNLPLHFAPKIPSQLSTDLCGVNFFKTPGKGLEISAEDLASRIKELRDIFDQPGKRGPSPVPETLEIDEDEILLIPEDMTEIEVLVRKSAGVETGRKKGQLRDNRLRYFEILLLEQILQAHPRSPEKEGEGLLFQPATADSQRHRLGHLEVASQKALRRFPFVQGLTLLPKGKSKVFLQKELLPSEGQTINSPVLLGLEELPCLPEVFEAFKAMIPQEFLVCRVNFKHRAETSLPDVWCSQGVANPAQGDRERWYCCGKEGLLPEDNGPPGRHPQKEESPG